MKTKKKYLTFLMTLLLCLSFFTGCSSTSSANDDDQEDTSLTVNADDESEDSIQEEDIIGEVTYVGSSYLSLTTYESASEITDYTSVDVSTLTEAGGMKYVYPDDTAEYYKVDSAALVSASYEELTVGCMIAVTTGSDGVQQIIILKEAEDGELTDDTATEESGDDGETLLADTYVVAEVTAINDDGSLSLLNYVSTEDAIEDYTAVDFTQFISDGTYSDYVIPDGSVVYLVEDSELTQLTADYIVVGDMLVIYTDEAGVTNLMIYPAEAETEVTE